MPIRIASCRLAASRRTHVMVAAMIWTIVGLGLLGFGLKWLIQSETSWLPLLVFGLLAIGFAKGFFVLRKTARRTIVRIMNRGDNRCLGGVFSWSTWVLVILMMVGGRLLRGSGLPLEILGCIYAGIGVALLVGSSVSWAAFRNMTQEPPSVESG